MGTSEEELTPCRGTAVCAVTLDSVAAASLPGQVDVVVELPQREGQVVQRQDFQPHAVHGRRGDAIPGSACISREAVLV